jgi:hypothetical protein
MNADPMDIFSVVVATAAGLALVLVLWHQGEWPKG